jgi:hypothetical protein
MPQFNSIPDEPDLLEGAVTAQFPQTGFAHELGDDDWWRLVLGPGTHQISVLPDLVQIVFPDDVAEALEVPPDTPILFQETAVSAVIYQVVRVTGDPLHPAPYTLVRQIGSLSVETDSLAMQGRESFIDIEFLTGLVTLPEADSEVVPTWDFVTQQYVNVTYEGLQDYYLYVGASPIFLRSSDGTGVDTYTDFAGRYLITIGDPTGQRSSEWGGWIETYDVFLGTPPADPIPSLFPNGSGLLPIIVPGQLPGQFEGFQSPAYHDGGTAGWTALPTNVPLPEIAPGEGGLLAAMANEVAGRFAKFIKDAANNLGLDWLTELYDQIENFAGIREMIVQYVRDLMSYVQQATNPNADGSELDQQVNERSEQFTQDVRQQIAQNVGATPEQFLQSMTVDEGHSDIQYTVFFDARPGMAVHLLPDGHEDLVSARFGPDWIHTGDLDDVVFGNGGDDVLNGGTGDDFLVGGNGTDGVQGGAGNDELWGNAGSDVVFGGAGNDPQYGGDGQDMVDGGDGSDVVHGDPAGDLVLGNLGADTIYGGDGAGAADDWLVGDGLFGGAGGNDLIYGGAGADVVIAGVGDDTVYGGADSDQIQGGAGNDVLAGDGGADLLDGGAGADRFVVDGDDLIVDWNAGDIVDLRGLGIGSLASLAITSVGGGLLVSHVGSGLALTVLLDEGEGLGSGDFLFT